MMNRVRLCFSNSPSASELFYIFCDEVKRLIPILNKKYRTSLKYEDFEFYQLDYFDGHRGDLNYPYSYFDIGTQSKYILALYSYHAILIYNNPKSRPHNIYDSIGNFIKDCACHELFHAYDFELNHSKGSSCNHEGWWKDNYKDFRKAYTNSELIIDKYFDERFNKWMDVAYFSKCSKYLKFYLSDYKLTTTHTCPIDIPYLVSGGYLNFLNMQSPFTRNYDIVLSDLSTIYELRRFDHHKRLLLCINYRILDELIRTRSIDVLEALAHQIEGHYSDYTIDEAIKRMKSDKNWITMSYKLKLVHKLVTKKENK